MDAADDLYGQWAVEEKPFFYPGPRGNDFPFQQQDFIANSSWNVAGPLMLGEFDRSSAPKAPQMLPDFLNVGTSIHPSMFQLSSEFDMKSTQPPFPKRPRVDYNPLHVSNGACSCPSCVSPGRQFDQFYSIGASEVPTPYLTPVSCTPSSSATHTPASNASTPTPTENGHKIASKKSRRSSDDCTDTESDDMSLGLNIKAEEDDDDEFNSDDADHHRRRGRKRSRSGATARAVDPFLLPKSAPSQNPDRVIMMAESVELTVGKLLSMTTQEIKDMHLSADLEEQVKKQRRLLRNRESAAMSRAKRRDLLSTLEARSQDLVCRLKKLDGQIDDMRRSNTDLRHRIDEAKKTKPSRVPLLNIGPVFPPPSVNSTNPAAPLTLQRSVAPMQLMEPSSAQPTAHGAAQRISSVCIPSNNLGQWSQTSQVQSTPHQQANSQTYPGQSDSSSSTFIPESYLAGSGEIPFGAPDSLERSGRYGQF